MHGFGGEPSKDSELIDDDLAWMQVSNARFDFFGGQST